MGRECDRLWEIDAVRDGRLSSKDAAASARHVQVCADCSAVVARNRDLRELAATLSPSDPDDLELRRLRACILRDAAPGPAPAHAVRRVLGAAFVAVAIATLIAVRHWRGRASPPTATSEFSSTIAPAEGARWARERQGAIERVRLESGTLRIHVRHQARDERFLVLVPDGQMEVRGTTFEVSANPRSTERVHVDDGTVTLRLRQSADVQLSAGDTWEAEPPATPVLPPSESPQPTSAPTSASDPHSTVRAPAARRRDPSSLPSDDGADAYADAVGTMARHKFADAAVAFHDFVAAHPRSAEAEDASFLEAVALAREGRADAAAQAAECHLKQFPSSFHRKEAAILVARAKK
jgi:TolA-binding protein